MATVATLVSSRAIIKKAQWDKSPKIGEYAKNYEMVGGYWLSTSALSTIDTGLDTVDFALAQADSAGVDATSAATLATSLGSVAISGGVISVKSKDTKNFYLLYAGVRA